jgi:hypothetical protein
MTRNIVTGFITSLVIIFILANHIESGDINAVSMYFVVFIIPAFVIVLLNSIALNTITLIKQKTAKIILASIPFFTLLGLSFIKEIRFSFFDGNLNFVAIVGAVAVGLTNLIWIISLFQGKVK